EGNDAYPLFQRLIEAAELVENVDIASEEERKKNEETRQENEKERQNRIADIEDRFSKLTTEQQQDAEVIDARHSTTKDKTFNSLKGRLEDIEQDIDEPKETSVFSYSNVIHAPDNAVNGQLGIKLEGNTITNLADVGEFIVSRDEVGG